MRRFPRVTITLLALAFGGCAAETSPRPPAAQDAPTAALPAGEAEAPPPMARVPVDVPDRALEESTDSRDPFRPPAAIPTRRDRELYGKARRYPIADLKLTGLVTGAGAPRAMLLDPRGHGWIVTTGELVGLPETVGDAATGDILASWRVDRIRDGELVLVREDPTHRAPSAHRVLSIRPDHEPRAFDD
ncbi:MAG: hypothetical protein U0359_40470 [Byssovorax sp.]